MTTCPMPLTPPITGRWTIDGYPPRVLVNGISFRRARLTMNYPGVVEQYREERATNAMHLKVFADGSFSIDHRDCHNPEEGSWLGHLLRDFPGGPALFGLGAFALYALLSSGEERRGAGR